jgi:energy-coupling factor transporter ATP-binding protein EcfA2
VNFEFKPQAKQLILGTNGTGKSAFFQALRALRDFAALGEKADQVFGDESRTRWQVLDRQTFELEVTGNGGTYLYTLWVESKEGRRSRVRREELDFDGKPLALLYEDEVNLFDDGHDRRATFQWDFDVSPLTSGLANRSSKLQWFTRWLSGLYCFRIDPTRVAAEGSESDDRLEDDLTNFAGWYGHVIQEKTGALLDLRKALGDVLDSFDSLDLRLVGRKTRVLRAVFSESGTPKPKRFEFDFDELSDGQRALIVLYTLLYTIIEPDATICIDEPDNFLALAEIQPWLFALSDRIEDVGAQAILVSHHPELIDILAPEHGVIFSRSGLGAVRVEPYRTDAIGKLAPSERVARGWERV